MKERPIIFSTEMVRAILEGRKTQTRRTRGLSLINDPPQNMADWQLVAMFQDGKARFATPDGKGDITLVCPYGGFGDRLWVKETWDDSTGILLYKADCLPQDRPEEMRWISPLFMSREDSRITLEITEIRVERLQEITEKDAIKEGLSTQPGLTSGGNIGLGTARYWYKKLWDSLNAKRGYGWEANLWVWILSFATGVRKLGVIK